MYDFFVYTGKEKEKGHEDQEINQLQNSAQVVAKQCKHLRPDMNHKVYSDTWFTTADLLLYITRRAILACGTMHINQVQGCSLASETEMKKDGRGSFDFNSDVNSGVIIIKWCDCSSVHLASTFVGV